MHANIAHQPTEIAKNQESRVMVLFGLDRRAAIALHALRAHHIRRPLGKAFSFPQGCSHSDLRPAEFSMHGHASISDC